MLDRCIVPDFSIMWGYVIYCQLYVQHNKLSFVYRGPHLALLKALQEVTLPDGRLVRHKTIGSALIVFVGIIVVCKFDVPILLHSLPI